MKTCNFWGFIMHKKSSFPLRIVLVNVTKSTALVTFTEEIRNGKLHFFCRVNYIAMSGTFSEFCKIAFLFN